MLIKIDQVSLRQKRPPFGSNHLDFCFIVPSSRRLCTSWFCLWNTFLCRWMIFFSPSTFVNFSSRVYYVFRQKHMRITDKQLMFYLNFFQNCWLFVVVTSILYSLAMKFFPFEIRKNFSIKLKAVPALSRRWVFREGRSWRFRLSHKPSTKDPDKLWFLHTNF